MGEPGKVESAKRIRNFIEIMESIGQTDDDFRKRIEMIQKEIEETTLKELMAKR